MPNGPEATAALSRAFFQLTDYPVEDRAKVPSEELSVGGGRTIHVPKSLKGVAVFSFKRLCGEPRGAADYLAIAQRFHTVIIVGIPVMGPEMRNEAARFVTLIDALYEHKVKLLAAADAEPSRSTRLATAPSNSSAPSAGSKRCARPNIWRRGTALPLDGLRQSPHVHHMQPMRILVLVAGLLFAHAERA